MRVYQIDTSPFKLLVLAGLECGIAKNQHGYARISGYISDEQKNALSSLMLGETWGDIWFTDENGGRHLLFCGYIEDMNIQVEADTYLLTVLLETGTKLMDINQHIRVFQTGSTTYEKILDSIMATYTDGNFIMGQSAGTIGTMVVQYKETDWEFVNRLAARKNMVVLPNEKSPGVKYTFGIVEGNSGELSSYESYSISNEVGTYQMKKENGISGIEERDAIIYKVKSREVFYLGDSVSFMGQNCIISEVQRKWEENQLYNYYTLELPGGIKQVAYYNRKIIGASLKGTVSDVKKDTVKINISEEETGGWAGKKWFAYSTIYSSPDGTGWYCMPEKGDSIRLYFPSEKEEEAYVNSSVNMQSANTEARSNPDEKSIKNKQGKEVLFKPDRLIFTNNNGMSIEIIDEEGIRIESDKSVVIKAKDNIELVSSEQSIGITAPEKIVLEQGQTVLQLEEDVSISGGLVNMQ